MRDRRGRNQTRSTRKPVEYETHKFPLFSGFVELTMPRELTQRDYQLLKRWLEFNEEALCGYKLPRSERELPRFSEAFEEWQAKRHD